MQGERSPPLPDAVEWDPAAVASVVKDDQVRVWWGRTPIDLFFRASAFHDDVATRARWMPFADTELPFLSAEDLAVFKSLFDRPKDWLDIAAMADSGSLDVRIVADVLERRYWRLMQPKFFESMKVGTGVYDVAGKLSS